MTSRGGSPRDPRTVALDAHIVWLLKPGNVRVRDTARLTGIPAVQIPGALSDLIRGVPAADVAVRLGLRPEQVRELDHIRRGQMSRNALAALTRKPPRTVTYALHRLRAAGHVVHDRRGNGGHGTWRLV